MSDIKNPLTKYYTGDYKWQPQKMPGIQAQMTPIPDCGETSYQGHQKLKGRKALITGGDSGIGRAAAIAFVREGADIVINYLPDEEQDAQDVRSLLEKEGGKVILMPGDVSEESFCQKLVHETVEKLGGLDILCPVAGKQAANEDITTLSTEQIVQTYATNVFAMMWLAQTAVPYLKPGSSIIHTTSMQAYQPSGDLLDYAGTKAAIRAFTQGLAKQLAPKGIRVNAVAPGPVWTPLQICGGQLKEGLIKFGQNTPLKRAGQPAELAEIYVFLASDASSFVTGSIYSATGGMVTA